MHYLIAVNWLLVALSGRFFFFIYKWLIFS